LIGYIACPECNGTGYIERERVAPWIDRDTPPDLVAYDEVCELCQGDGEIETNKHEEDDES
jgi:DnaJ-class molecular chaperone